MTEAQAETVVEETQEQGNEIADVFTEKGDNPEQPKMEPKKDQAAEDRGNTEPPSEDEDQSHVPIAALQDVRRKHREEKERADKAEARLRELDPALDEDAPDPLEDPEGFRKHVAAQVLKEERNKRIEKSRDRMIEKHADYFEKEKVFEYLAKTVDESLVEQMNEAADPAAFAYETAKAYQDKQREEVLKTELPKLKESLREEILKEIRESSEIQAKKKSAVEAPDLTDAAAAGSNSEPVAKTSDIKGIFADSPL